MGYVQHLICVHLDKDNTVDHIIVGGGIAGTAAAEQVRRMDADARITIITAEPYPLYSRILLTEFLAGKMEESRVFVRKREWYETMNIRLLTGVRVESIAPPSARVTTSTGESYRYDRLLLATGGVSFMPSLPGSHLGGIFTLRTLEDARQIMEHTRQNKKVIVLGGGVLGLEAGYSLLRSGMEVSVVEFFPRLLPRQMDVPGAALLQRNMEKTGFRFYLGAKTREIVGQRKVEGLLLEDGTRLECDTLLVSAGVRPNRQLTDSLGLPADKGVQVDDRMETPVPGIYAAGDLVEHRKVYYGLWGAAQRQGEVAGVNMAGGDDLYTGTTISNQLKVAGVDLLAAGDIDPENTADSVVVQDTTRSVYRKIVFREGKVAGTILYGDLTDRKHLLDAIRNETPANEMSEILSRWNASSS